MWDIRGGDGPEQQGQGPLGAHGPQHVACLVALDVQQLRPWDTYKQVLNVSYFPLCLVVLI